MSVAASLVLARTLSNSGKVFFLGAGHTPTGCVEVPLDTAEEFLRSQTSSGDSVIVTENSQIPELERDRILRRCPAWGVSAVWSGTASRPEDGLAVCIEETDMVQLLEHATHLSEDPVAIAPSIIDCTDEVCVTCSDEGRIGEVISSPAALFRPALVRTSEGIEEVDVTLVGNVNEHDLILIHAGGAIALLSETSIQEAA